MADNKIPFRHRKPKGIIECLFCKTIFRVVNSRIKRAKYCSRSCRAKGTPSPWKGKSPTPETRLKMRMAKLGIRGENHWNWRGGKGKTERKIAMSRDEYKQWRLAIFERDDYRCFDCGERGKYLNADHIFPWAYFPRLRYEIENGRTLCRECHEKTNTWGAKVHLAIAERN